MRPTPRAAARLQPTLLASDVPTGVAEMSATIVDGWARYRLPTRMAPNTYDVDACTTSLCAIGSHGMLGIQLTLLSAVAEVSAILAQVRRQLRNCGRQ